MVDYWESKRLMEQTYGEHQMLVNGSTELLKNDSSRKEDEIAIDDADAANGMTIQVDSLCSSDDEDNNVMMQLPKGQKGQNVAINKQLKPKVTKSNLEEKIKQLKIKNIEVEKAMKD